MKNTKFNIFIALFLSLFAPKIFAGPESDVVGITMMRPYTNAPGGTGTNIYMAVDSSVFCGTEMFVIDTTRAGGKEAYAAALAAMMNGKKIRIEVDSCAGWGTPIRSIYVMA